MKARAGRSAVPRAPRRAVAGRAASGALAAAALAVCAALAAGCAPRGAYGGARPAPGALMAFAGGPSPLPAPTGAPAPRAVIEGADPARHHLGRLVPARDEGAVTVLVYGDNRPGFRTEAGSPFFPALKHPARDGAAGLARAAVALPLFLVNAFVPALDGPRDLVSLVTRRPRGGGEAAVLRALSREDSAALVVSTGDLVREGDRGRLWEDFARRHAALRARVPYVAAPGNHERTDLAAGDASWREVMGPTPAPGRYWWTLDVPAADARFVFLDTNVLADPGDRREAAREEALAEAMLAWADSALAAPRALTFVVLHHPLVTAGTYADDWRPREPGAPAARRRARLLEQFARHGVDAVFAGHEHLYQRVWLARPDGGGFWHVTTGGGGSPLYAPHPAARDAALAGAWPAGLRPERATVRAERAHHYLRLVLPRGGGGARFDVVRVRGGRGETLESVTIGRPEAR